MDNWSCVHKFDVEIFLKKTCVYNLFGGEKTRITIFTCAFSDHFSSFMPSLLSASGSETILKKKRLSDMRY